MLESAGRDLFIVREKRRGEERELLAKINRFSKSMPYFMSETRQKGWGRRRRRRKVRDLFCTDRRG
jgi:hypothetical protein